MIIIGDTYFERQLRCVYYAVLNMYMYIAFRVLEWSSCDNAQHSCIIFGDT